MYNYNMFFASILLVGLAVCGSHGLASAASQTYIYDGKSATIEEYPFMVGILDKGEFACPGVIIGKSWVMTLGDCIYSISASEMTVVAGSSDGINGTSYSVSTTTKPADYDHDFNAYASDFGLVQIKKKFTWSNTVGYAKLPSSAPSTNSKVTAVGFNDPSIGGLRQGVMKWQSSKVCKSYYGISVNYDSTMGCAYDKGKVTLCSNDYGDAFVKNGVVYGIFSGSNSDCNSSAEPVLLSNVAGVVDWISSTTGIEP